MSFSSFNKSSCDDQNVIKLQSEFLLKNLIRDKCQKEGLGDTILFKEDACKKQPESIVNQSVTFEDDSKLYRRAAAAPSFTPEINLVECEKISGLLSKLIEDYAATDKGQRTKAEAEQIKWKAVTKDSFKSTLREIFIKENGKDKVVKVFYFVSIAVVRLGKDGYKEMISDIVEATQEFMWEYICMYVKNNGGWGKVLGEVQIEISRRPWLYFFLAIIIIVLIALLFYCGYFQFKFGVYDFFNILLKFIEKNENN